MCDKNKLSIEHKRQIKCNVTRKKERDNKTQSFASFQSIKHQRGLNENLIQT